MATYLVEFGWLLGKIAMLEYAIWELNFKTMTCMIVESTSKSEGPCQSKTKKCNYHTFKLVISKNWKKLKFA